MPPFFWGLLKIVTENEHDYGKNTSAKVLSITSIGILLSLPLGDFFLDYKSYPWFKDAKVNEIFDVQMEGDFAVRWDKLDVDLEIESIINPEQYPLTYQ